jgi:hypothetical protein
MSSDQPHERASIFGDDQEPPIVDVGRFQPKPSTLAPKAPDKDVVRAISEANRFPSRQPISATTATEQKRPRRIHRTGRNIQFNIKVSQESLDRFYRIADAEDWVLGEAFEHAVTALEQHFKHTKHEE